MIRAVVVILTVWVGLNVLFVAGYLVACVLASRNNRRVERMFAA